MNTILFILKYTYKATYKNIRAQCLSFLGLLKQMTTNLEQQKFILSQSGGQKSEIKVLAGCAPSEAPAEGPSCLCQVLGLQASLGLWPRRPHLCLPSLPALCSSVS